MRTRFKSLLALGLTFAAGCFVGIVIGSSNQSRGVLFSTLRFL